MQQQIPGGTQLTMKKKDNHEEPVFFSSRQIDNGKASTNNMQD